MGRPAPAPARTSGGLAVFRDVFASYRRKVPSKLQVIDTYIAFTVVSAAVQLLFCCVVGRFPFNSFLGGFISSVACGVLGVSLRMHVNPDNDSQWAHDSAVKALAQWLFAQLIVHFAVFNFIG